MGQVELNSLCSEAKDFLTELDEHSGVDVSLCYQCGTCAAGCSVGFASDYSPRQVMRMLQLGLVDDVLKSSLIWLCTGCGNCVTRCPRQLNIPHMNDTLRMTAKENGYITEKNVDIFNNAFLSSVKRYGRIFEGAMTMEFNLRSGQPFKDVMQGPKLALKGKLSPFPHKIKGRAQMKRIFETSMDKKGGK